VNNRECFEHALKLIKEGQYDAANAQVILNPLSDQRIIEKRIQEAMANDANSTERHD